jgi:hypothetical protein
MVARCLRGIWTFVYILILIVVDWNKLFDLDLLNLFRYFFSIGV